MDLISVSCTRIASSSLLRGDTGTKATVFELELRLNHTAEEWRHDMIKAMYQNNRNENKFIEVVRYNCGHYHAVQFMRFGNIINRLGSRTGRRFRWYKKPLLELLNEDYHEVPWFEVKLVHKYLVWTHEVKGA